MGIFTQFVVSLPLLLPQSKAGPQCPGGKQLSLKLPQVMPPLLPVTIIKDCMQACSRCHE